MKRTQTAPVRVRVEPPTLEEAIFAAAGLTPEVDQQIEIAASLMGVSEEEVRSAIAERNARALRTRSTRAPITAVATTTRRVIVEHKPARRFVGVMR